ncbi:MAG TPA: hypothetical protein VG797_02860 [Phycisphaerales bacterium]|nr:hypothetical protein [Phycisphaerales bacterium]
MFDLANPLTLFNGDLPRHDRRRIVRAIPRPISIRFAAILMGAMGVWHLIVIASSGLTAVGGWLRLIGGSAMLLMPIYILCGGHMGRVEPKRIVRAFLDIPRCPSCAHSLADLAASPDDGCTVCPECGSAWDLN